VSYFSSVSKRSPSIGQTADNNGVEWSKEMILEKMLCTLVIPVEFRLKRNKQEITQKEWEKEQ